MYELNELVKIDKRFQTSVNLLLDRDNVDKFTGYIPTESSVYVLKRYLKNLQDGGENASILIGPYGKGKSHLLLLLMGLLEQRFPGEAEEVIGEIGRIDKECEEMAEALLQGKPYLTVLVSDTGISLNNSLLLALKNALVNKKLKELIPDSYYSEAIKTIKRWEKEFPGIYQQFSDSLGTSDGYGMSVQELLGALQRYEETAMERFQNLYSSITGGSVFEPLLQTECLKVFQEINHKLCQEYGYAGIFILFDEFSKYIEGHAQEGFAADMKVLQDMCELANSSRDERLVITCVAHKSMKEYGNKLSEQVKNAFRGVEGRLKEYLFVVSARNSFALIKSVLQKTDKFPRFCKTKEWKKYRQELAVRSFELPFFRTQFSPEEYEEMLVTGCFPLTPLSAAMVLLLSEKVAQNERTVFTFLTDEGGNSLFHRIKAHGAKSYRDNNSSMNISGCIGADAIYDYFAAIFRENMDRPEIHNEWLKAEYALKHAESSEAAGIIKTIAVLHIIGNREELPVTLENISLASGIETEVCRTAMEKMQEQQLIIWRSRLGVYAFKNNIGVNLDEELKKEIDRQPRKINYVSCLPEVSELEYILPKSYNQQYTITRYFQYVFMLPETFQSLQSAEYLFDERFADGKILAFIAEDEINVQGVKEKLEELKDDRLVVLIPEGKFSQEQNLRKILAIRRLLQDEEFLEENKVLRQELLLYQEDILFEINAALEQDYLPDNGRCKVLHYGEQYCFEEGEYFNHFLSNICGSYYSFAPKVNHELLNICNVTGQYLKARNVIVEAILQEESFEKYEKGTSPEALIFRTALLRTGVLGGKYPLDVGTGRILEEIKTFLLESGKEKKCFGELYARLQGKDYGVRRGVMPLFLAVQMMSVVGIPILYLQNKEVLCSVEILNNINEHPEQYYLYLEKDNHNKESYLSYLETYLGITVNAGCGKNLRMCHILEGLQRAYRALPKLVSNWKELDREEWETALREYEGGKEKSQESIWVRQIDTLYAASEKLKNSLRRFEVNPRELLFEKIPYYLEQYEVNLACAESIVVILYVWKRKKEYFREQLSAYLLQQWGKEADVSLSGVLTEWYEGIRDGVQRAVLSARAAGIIRYIETLSGYDNGSIAEDMARLVCSVYLEDWTEEAQQEFEMFVPRLKEEIEQAGQEEKVSGEQKKIAISSAEGGVIEKSFSAEWDTVGDFLKNAIQDALEEFGDSMETGQKVAVLVDALEELLK